MFLVYKLTSPSGRCYIGLTGTSLRRRWCAHVTRAIRNKAHHPLSAAIRKYGKDSFRLEVIHRAETLLEAKSLEIAHICSFPEGRLYNLTLGGETDAGDGGRLFWKRLKEKPEEHAAYLRKLSETKKKADWTDYQGLIARGLEWRRSNARQAYYSSYRAIRIANRAQGKSRRVPADTRPLKERLLWKHKRSVPIAKNTTEQWARLSSEDRTRVGQKIRLRQQARHVGMSEEDRRVRTEKARSSIDRKKQGAAASKGLRRYWEDLKADPVRYAAYRAKRGWKP